MTTNHTQFTPGPWFLSINKDVVLSGGNTGNEDPEVIAECHPSDIMAVQNELEREANARLIAAAPKMLGRLKEIVEYWRENDPDMYSSDIATDTIDVIREATGQN